MERGIFYTSITCAAYGGPVYTSRLVIVKQLSYVHAICISARISGDSMRINARRYRVFIRASIIRASNDVGLGCRITER